jgi:phenylpropionate dioxygenase-like ring-hydroxylating dioxygenase large terminal subunit
VGHESEVAEPGDYARKTLGLQDVIMTRGADGAAAGPSLAEHLGEAAGELDRLARLSPEGKVG